MRHAAALLLAALLGGAYGFLATLGHQAVLRLGELVVPWGIVMAVLGTAALLTGIRLVTHDRWLACAAAVGMMAVVFVLSLPGPGGSVVVPESVAGTVWAVAPTLVAVLVVAWPSLPARRPAPA